MATENAVPDTIPGRRSAFHSEMSWNLVQVPLPPGRGHSPLPEGMSFLWLSRFSGTAVSTSLGTGPIEGSICIYGHLTDPVAEPPGNGQPVGWTDGRMTFTAENGDRLLATIQSTGMSGEPGASDWHFTEEGAFVDGGTGRFQHAEGRIAGAIYPLAQTAVYDGWIRFGET